MKARIHVASVSAMALAVSLHAAPASAQQTPVDPSTAPSSTAVAPEPDAASDNQLQDIIVTAQRREESLSRVGITVTAVGAEELQSRGVTSPADLVKLVPGFQATSSYGGAPVYTLRGIGFNTPNASATAPVGIYLDEAAVAYPYMSLGLVFDLERVEVLKGPQGTLYGRNATGGLINYVAGKPTATREGGFGIEVGSYGTINANAYVSGPLGDAVRVRLAVNSLNRGKDFQHSITRDEGLGKLYQKAARLTVDVGTADSPFSATLTGSYWKRDGDTLGSQAIYYVPDASAASAPFGSAAARASLQPNPTRNRDVDFLSFGRQPDAANGIIHPPPIVDSEFYSGSAKLGYEFSPTVRVQSLTSYQHLRQRDVSDAGGVQTESVYIDAKNRINSFSQEVRLIGDSDRFNWSLGGYYAHDRVKGDDTGHVSENAQITRLRAIGAFFVPHPNYTNAQILGSFARFRDIIDVKTDVYAGFANADFKFNDVIKLTLGGRYTRDKIDFEGCTYDTDGNNIPLINTVYPLFTGGAVNLQPNACYTLNRAGTNFVQGTVNNNLRQNNFAFRANVDITPSDRTLLYASISRGYKSGGFPSIAASSIAQFDPIEQEKLTSYEVGTKLGLLDRTVQLNLSAFYYDYTNKQAYGRIQDIIFTTLTRIRNIPRSREYGVEGDLTWRLSSALTAHVAGTYLNSKILEYTDFNDFGVFVNNRGRPFAYTPKFTGNGGLAYDGPVNDSLNFIADANASYQSKASADVAGLPQFAIKDYALVDGSIGIRAADNSWRVALYGTNLFDTYYWTGVVAATDSVFRYPGMPRQLGVRANFRF